MGVQIETMKEGDGVTFPQKGQKVTPALHALCHNDSFKQPRPLPFPGVLPLCAHFGEWQEGGQLQGPWQAFPVHPG